MKTIQTVILAALLVIGLGCGYSKKPNMPATPGTMPNIVQLNPASATSGGAAFMLEVDGTNFDSTAFVTFNNAQMMTTRTNSGKVMASIPASAIMNSGTVQVTVTNPGTPGGIYGGGTQPATSQSKPFTIN
jgi:hypothetical protein